MGIEGAPVQPEQDSALIQAQLQAELLASSSSGQANTTARESANAADAPVWSAMASNTMGPVNGPGATPGAAPNAPVDASLPIKPHWVSFDSGVVQVEVLRMAREGGGQVTLELTPPDEGRYRLDLRIDTQGRASLIVEGASESIRTRLEMGESSLRQQFAQMGLELNLQMRSQHDQGSAEPQSFARRDVQPGQQWDEAVAPTNLASRRAITVDLERGLVRLYA